MPRRSLLAVLAAMLCAVPVAASARPEVPPGPAVSSRADEEVAFVANTGGDVLEVASDITPVAPGITHEEVQLLDRAGWLDIDVLDIDLADEAVAVDLLTAPAVAATEVLTSQAGRGGAVAGVNGDFFDIGTTGAALGGEVEDGALRKSPSNATTGDRNHQVGIGGDGLGALADIVLDATANTPVGPLALDLLNVHAVGPDQVGAWTPEWGGHPLDAVVGGDASTVRVDIVDGVVAAAPAAVSAPIPVDGFALVGRGSGADRLATLVAGDAVDLEIGFDSDADYATAVGGGPVLVRDGAVPAGLDDATLAPRTAIAFDDDRDRMWLVVVDGRQSDSRGMTLAELGEYLVREGADAAMNLDGGGSSTMVAREPGMADVAVVNDPSDGGQRPVPNGLGLLRPAGSAEVAGFVLADGRGEDELVRVFPGLTRQLVATPYDETRGPADADPTWQAAPAAVATVDADGLVTGGRTGTGTVTVRERDVRGEVSVRTLGPLVRVALEPGAVSLDDAGESTVVTTLGFDAAGWRAPIEPTDVELDYDESVIDVEPTDDGRLQVTALVPDGGTVMTATVHGVATSIPVTVGLRTVEVEDFDDCTGTCGWTVFDIGAPGSSLVRGDGVSGDGLRLDYEFTGPRSTRAAYAFTPGTALELPREPQTITVSIDGDAKGAWLRTSVEDATGTRYTLNFTGQQPGIDWTGWQDVTATVPTGVQYPLVMRHLYPVETQGDERYAGSLGIDDLRVGVAQSLDVPTSERAVDPIWSSTDDLDPRRWTFAVLNDAQFTADAPDSRLVEEARRALREVVASDAEFLVVNGDFVDTNFPEDFDLARRILDEEVGDALPVYYQPGNHEVLGTDRIDEFVQEFGATRRSFDHRGVRFVLLNSAFGSLRASDFDQLVDLRATLDATATDPSVDQVVVMAHHPTNDPLPTDNSQLSDRLEVALLEDWFTEFEVSSGKDVAYVAGHAGVFAADRVDGVSYVIGGNVAKDPAGPAEVGGVTGWTRYGVDPTAPSTPDHVAVKAAGRPSRASWLLADLNPLLDRIEVVGDGVVEVGGETSLAFTGVQSDGRRIPLTPPVGTTWEGERVHVGLADNPPRRPVAAYDPATGALVGLRAGSGALTVTTNGTTVTVPVSVG